MKNWQELTRNMLNFWLGVEVSGLKFQVSGFKFEVSGYLVRSVFFFTYRIKVL